MNSLDFIDRAAIPRTGRLGIAFGLERLAFIPFRAPTVTILAALAIAVLAILGIQRIKTDDSLSQLFRSEDPTFKQFEANLSPIPVERVRRPNRLERPDLARPRLGREAALACH